VPAWAAPWARPSVSVCEREVWEGRRTGALSSFSTRCLSPTHPLSLPSLHSSQAPSTARTRPSGTRCRASTRCATSGRRPCPRRPSSACSWARGACCSAGGRGERGRGGLRRGMSLVVLSLCYLVVVVVCVASLSECCGRGVRGGRAAGRAGTDSPGGRRERGGGRRESCHSPVSGLVPFASPSPPRTARFKHDDGQVHASVSADECCPLLRKPMDRFRSVAGGAGPAERAKATAQLRRRRRPERERSPR